MKEDLVDSTQIHSNCFGFEVLSVIRADRSSLRIKMTAKALDLKMWKNTELISKPTNSCA